MAKPKKMESLVKEVLENHPETRGDNFLLYAEVLYHFVDIAHLTFAEVCLHHVSLGIPSLETITRCRRKLQEKHPELLDPKALKKRAEEEALHIEYSRS